MLFRVNEITKFLDMYAETNRMFSHYIVYEKPMFEDIILIRVPGGTVGNIFIDKDNVITKIKIDTKYCVEYTDDNIEDIINDKFVGKVYDFSKDEDYYES